jgi:catechol 2,3-dioxygenase-like lactoylglutathione lyase family enzyme
MAGNNKAIGGGGFHHVAIKVANFDESVMFYTRVLGFTEFIRWGEGDNRAILLDCGDGNFFEVFAGGQPVPADAKVGGAGPIIHVALRSDDVDGAVARARAGGAEITLEPKDVTIPSNPPTPVRIAFCRAPGGEVIEFFKHLDG